MFLKALKSFHDNGIYSSSWLIKVKSILDKTGMSYIWNIPDDGLPPLTPPRHGPVISKIWLKKTLNQRLSDIYEQDWLGDVNSNSQCKIYRMYKEKLAFESYLIKLHFSHRINLCKFRCVNSKLPIVV